MDTVTLLRIALTARGITAGQFAQSLTPPISEGMLYAVASGRKKSARVQREIDKLIRQQMRRLRTTAVAAEAA